MRLVLVEDARAESATPVASVTGEAAASPHVTDQSVANAIRSDVRELLNGIAQRNEEKRRLSLKKHEDCLADLHRQRSEFGVQSTSRLVTRKLRLQSPPLLPKLRRRSLSDSFLFSGLPSDHRLLAKPVMNKYAHSPGSDALVKEWIASPSKSCGDGSLSALVVTRSDSRPIMPTKPVPLRPPPTAASSPVANKPPSVSTPSQAAMPSEAALADDYASSRADDATCFLTNRSASPAVAASTKGQGAHSQHLPRYCRPSALGDSVGTVEPADMVNRRPQFPPAVQGRRAPLPGTLTEVLAARASKSGAPSQHASKSSIRSPPLRAPQLPQAGQQLPQLPQAGRQLPQLPQAGQQLPQTPQTPQPACSSVASSGEAAAPRLSALENYTVRLTAQPAAEVAVGLATAVVDAIASGLRGPSGKALIDAAQRRHDEEIDRFRRCAHERAARLHAFRECAPIAARLQRLNDACRQPSQDTPPAAHGPSEAVDPGVSAASGIGLSGFLDLQLCLAREGFLDRANVGRGASSAPYCWAAPAYVRHLQTQAAHVGGLIIEEGDEEEEGEETGGEAQEEDEEEEEEDDDDAENSEASLTPWVEGLRLWRLLISQGDVQPAPRSARHDEPDPPDGFAIGSSSCSTSRSNEAYKEQGTKDVRLHGRLISAALVEACFNLADAHLAHSHRRALSHDAKAMKKASTNANPRERAAADAADSAEGVQVPLQEYFDFVVSFVDRVTHGGGIATDKAKACSLEKATERACSLDTTSLSTANLAESPPLSRSAWGSTTDLAPEPLNSSPPTSHPKSPPSSRSPSRPSSRRGGLSSTPSVPLLEPTPSMALSFGLSHNLSHGLSHGLSMRSLPRLQLRHRWPTVTASAQQIEGEDAAARAQLGENLRKLSLLRAAITQREGTLNRTAAAHEFRTYCRQILGKRGTHVGHLNFTQLDRAFRLMAGQNYGGLTFRYAVVGREGASGDALVGASWADVFEMFCFLRWLDVDRDGVVSENDFCKSVLSEGGWVSNTA